MTISSSGGGSATGWQDCEVRYFVSKPCTSIEFSAATKSAVSRMSIGDSVTIACDVTPADTSDAVTYELINFRESGSDAYRLDGNTITRIGDGSAQLVAYCGYK